MKRCKYYDEDGDAWDKPCGFSKDSKCKYFNPRYYCPVFKKMKENREHSVINRLKKLLFFWK
jgi:hypothetical protein